MREDAALPCGEAGPEDFCAFRMLALNCALVAIGLNKSLGAVNAKNRSGGEEVGAVVDFGEGARRMSGSRV